MSYDTAILLAPLLGSAQHNRVACNENVVSMGV